MAPVARELGSAAGVLEPLQTAMTVDDQVGELTAAIASHGDGPAVLVGFSWGAWLAFLVAAGHPSVASKVILVGSGPFLAEYATGINDIRLGRLNPAERAEVESLSAVIEDPDEEKRKAAFARFGEIVSRADTYESLPEDPDPVTLQPDIFRAVWREAAELRKTGGLLAAASRIKCPVTAIHGDYDPHPARGVLEPLSAVLSDFRFVLLEKCGHKPWIERHARDEFYRVLKQEISI